MHSAKRTNDLQPFIEVNDFQSSNCLIYMLYLTILVITQFMKYILYCPLSLYWVSSLIIFLEHSLSITDAFFFFACSLKVVFSKTWTSVHFSSYSAFSSKQSSETESPVCISTCYFFLKFEIPTIDLTFQHENFTATLYSTFIKPRLCIFTHKM